MCTYTLECFSLIKNPNFKFYKLSINGYCQFDEFLEEVESNPNDKKWLPYIFRWMDDLSNTLYPATIFRNIKGAGRSDLYEFKKKNLRVYVIKQAPNIYIVLGGYKKNQSADIARLKALLKNFKLEYTDE